MKVIFLDVDGVLNSAEAWATTCEGSGCERLDPTMVSRLVRLVRESNAMIVVSSSWRHSKQLLPALKCRLTAAGVPAKAFIGETDSDPLGIRGREIAAWLRDNPGVSGMVILDDDADMEDLSVRHVKTSWARGMQDIHVDTAWQMLQWPMPKIADK